MWSTMPDEAPPILRIQSARGRPLRQIKRKWDNCDRHPQGGACGTGIAHIGAVIGPGYVQWSARGLATASGMRRVAADQLDRYRRAVADEKTGPDLEQVIRGAHVVVDPLRVYSNPGAPADATRQGLSSLTRPTENERKYQ